MLKLKKNLMNPSKNNIEFKLLSRKYGNRKTFYFSLFLSLFFRNIKINKIEIIRITFFTLEEKKVLKIYKLILRKSEAIK